MERPPPTIDGIYELGHVLYALDREGHGFGREDIAAVEHYWLFADFHASAAGFVVRLKDGRRAYIDLHHWHAFEQDEDFRITVSPLAADQRMPVLSKMEQPVTGWSEETQHLNRVLEG